MRNKFVFLILVIFIGTDCVRLYGQEHSGSDTISTFIRNDTADNQIIDSPQTIFFPEFYSFWPVDNNDTIFKYECFDTVNKLIDADTLLNMNYVHFILLIKTYTDYTRTYVDEDGKPQPEPVTSKVLRYDKSGMDGWLRKDFTTGEYANLQEYRDEIVRTDTAHGINPVTGNKQLRVRKYYKTEQMGSSFIENNK
jgi:hypothetical protein